MTLFSLRASAIDSEPVMPRLLSLTFKLVIALIVVWTVLVGKKYKTGIFSHLLPLGEECGRDDRAGSTQLLAAEVGFSHVRLHRDCLRVAEGDSRHRPIILDAISKGDNTCNVFFRASSI